MKNIDFFGYENIFDDEGNVIFMQGPLVDKIRKQEFDKLRVTVQKRIKLLVGMNGDEECIETLKWVLEEMNGEE
jgi:hypothetical protein